MVDSRRVALICGALLLAACSGLPQPVPLGRVTFDVAGEEVTLPNATCIWYEDSGQLFVEAGDSDGADYILLAAPLEWLGEPLPEGPGEPAELSLRVDGADLAADQDSLTGSMTLAQTDGSFSAQLADGASLSGTWQCPEVLDE